jgi:hypothetical protein
MQRVGPWCAVAAALACMAAPPVAASVMEALDLPDLVREADEIVLGEVTRRASRWDGDRIVTDVTLNASECLKGQAPPGAPLVVTHLGGSVGSVGMRVEGMPQLEVGARALVFVRRGARSGRLRPVGLSQGVLRVRRHAGVDEVLPGAHGVRLVRRGAGGQLLAAPGALMHPRPLAEVTAEIQRLVAQGRGR